MNTNAQPPLKWFLNVFVVNSYQPTFLNVAKTNKQTYISIN